MQQQRHSAQTNSSNSTNITHSRASMQQDQQLQQELQQHAAIQATNQHVPAVLSGPSKQPRLVMQQGQQQCSAAPDWLDEGSSLMGLQVPASTSAVAPAGAAPCTTPEPGFGSRSINSSAAVSGDVSAAGVLSAPDAATAADLLATLTAHARGQGNASTSGSSSSNTSISNSTAAAAVGVRVSSLLELQQLMLMLADAAAKVQHTQQLCGPCTQQQGSSSSRNRKDSSLQGDNNGLEGVCHAINSGMGSTVNDSGSSGVSVVLGPSWLQSVLRAAMEALSHADPSLGR
jgi:hypothetical protein